MNPKPLQSLQFETKRLVNGPVDFEFELQPEQFEIESDHEFQFNHPITGTIRANSAGGDTVLVTANLKTTVNSSCVRCLEDLVIPIHARVQQAWFLDPGEFVKEKEKDEERLYFDGSLLDPTETLREEIMIQLPAFPKCSAKDNPECAKATSEDETWSYTTGTAAELIEPVEKKGNNNWASQLEDMKSKLDKN